MGRAVVMLCLNPFEIRGSLKPPAFLDKCIQDGLNPFEIRGGLKHGGGIDYSDNGGLNPFEIRGGLKPHLILGL